MHTFHVLENWREIKKKTLSPGFYLSPSIWDDYTFKTTFTLYYTAGDTIYPLEVGSIKIGYHGQAEQTKTVDRIPKKFEKLPDGYFSLAESPEFYEILYNFLGEDSILVLDSLKSIVIDSSLYNLAKDEKVFNSSLMRDVNINTIKGQFKRILKGEKKSQRFNFDFVREGHVFSEMKLNFDVNSRSLPPSNIHAIIGRNGLGKTTLLNEMISSLISKVRPKSAGFYDELGFPIESRYFSTVVSVSFSAFDPFSPLSEQSDQRKGTCYYYIGLKAQESDINNENELNSAEIILDESCDDGFDEHEHLQRKISDAVVPLSELRKKYAQSVGRCFSDSAKKELWLDAIGQLESDNNFKDLDLKSLAKLKADEIIDECIERMSKMSSGHAVVLMTISRLVEVLQEKTLVLFDEPESHLHPPLLSAFVRSLSNLLSKRNGIAIMATHSPVVIQEIPKNCCWILTRFGEATSYSRPKIETFAENIGVITKEIFSFEVERSGFHQLFQEKVKEGHSLDEIVNDFEGNIGQEGMAILMVMVMLRDQKKAAGGKNA